MRSLHRMTAIGDWTLPFNIAFGLSLTAMLVTGMVMYIRLVGVRSRIGRKGLFWSAGGTWRSLHRAMAAPGVSAWTAMPRCTMPTCR